jgi:hypothetical protein
MTTPPDYVSISPMSVCCPKCEAAPWVVCEVILSDGLELVHVERIRVAAAIDLASVEKRGRTDKVA